MKNEAKALLAAVEAYLEIKRLHDIEAAWIIAEADRVAKESFETGILPDLFNLIKNKKSGKHCDTAN